MLCAPATYDLSAMDLVLEYTSNQKYESLRKLLKTVFKYGHKVFQALLGCMTELESENAMLRGEYRALNAKLRLLHHKVNDCIEVLKGHPTCNTQRKENIFAEIDGTDSEARLYIDSEEDNFPHIIDFLKEFGSWLDTVSATFENVSELRNEFDNETRNSSIRAQIAEYDARKWKRVSLGVAGTSVMVAGAGAGVLLGGGPQLYGGFLFVGGSSVALCSYLVLGSFEERESESHEFKTKLERLNQKAKKFENVIWSLEIKMNFTKLTQQQRNITNRPHPFIRDLKTTFQIIFEAFEEKYYDFEEEKRKIREMESSFS